VLQEARNNLGEWVLWLASADFSKAPRPHEAIKDTSPLTHHELGTKALIPANWSSPFKGKTVQDCVAFLKTAPDSSVVCVDQHHFVVLSEDYTNRGSVTICGIGDKNLRGDNLESMISCSVKEVSVFLYAMEPDYWEEKMAEREGEEPVG
jgi:hypothetical protein